MLKEHLAAAPIIEVTSDVYATLAEARNAQGKVEDMLSRHGCPERKQFEIRICLEEAVVNALKHGNAYDPGLRASLQTRLYKLPEPTVLEICEKVEGKPIPRIQESVSHLVHVLVNDQGQKDFHFDNIPDPLAKENLERTSGRGIRCLIHNYALALRLRERTSWPDDSGRSGGQIEMVFGFDEQQEEQE